MTILIWSICSKPANLRGFSVRDTKSTFLSYSRCFASFSFRHLFSQFFSFSTFLFCIKHLFSHLCVAASSKSLAAPLAAQTGPMPVLAQWCHLLGYGGKHTQMYTTLVTHRSNHFADSHLLAQTRFFIPRFLEAWNYLPKYTFLLHRGHRLASPEKVVMLAAVDTLQTRYNSGKAKGNG